MKNINTRLVHKEFQDNYLIEIRDTGTQRTLYFDTHHMQSAMSFQEPQDLVLSYTRYMLLGLLITPNPRNILMIGLGSGSFVRFFNHYYPDSRIDGVECSQHVIDIAKGYFHLPEEENIHITCADGNEFISHSLTDKKYDLILVDAFDAQGMAPTIYTESFFDSAGKLLTEEGSISFNLWSSDKKLFAGIKKSLAATFHSCLLLPVPDRGNVIAVAMNQEVPWNKIDPGQKELGVISARLQFDFRQLVRVAKQNNGALKARLRSLFT